MQQRRRTSVLVSAVALGLPLALLAGGPAPASASPTPAQPLTSAVAQDPVDPAAEAALRALRADADTALAVERGADGQVAQVRSRTGEAMLDSAATTPRAAAVEQLERHGEAFGIDGEDSTARVTRTLPSATGGSVVRAEQRVDGVPVLGGQVVLSLDADEGVVSVQSDTTAATTVPAPEVGQDRARRTAVADVVKRRGARAADLRVVDLGRALYDPALLGVTDPAGVRPVWRLEVTDGGALRETVLVGTRRVGRAGRRRASPTSTRRTTARAPPRRPTRTSARST